MSKVRPTDDDNVDLFELFETLWDSKWVISAFVALATLMGFAYSQLAQPVYYISAPYTLNIYSVNAQQICGNNVACLEKVAKKRLASLLGDEWNGNYKDNGRFSLSTTTLLALSEYQTQLESANVALTNEVYEEATAEIAFIKTELNDSLLTTEIVAKNMLRAMRVIQLIDNRQNVVSFGSVLVVKSSPKQSLIITLSFVFSSMLSAASVLVKYALKKRKG